MIRTLIGVVFSLLASVTAQAYPGYIGYGYTDCRVCHYHPLGNGPLTDYGRAMSATTLSGKIASTSDDDLAKTSGFFGPLMATPSFFSLQANYRGLYLMTGLESTAVSRWIHMQAEGTVVLREPSEKFFVVGTLGYAPVPAATPPSQRDSISTVISRRHYVAIKPFDRLGVYAGFMDQAFGIQVPDHNSFLRSKSFLNINDQTHGVLVFSGGRSWDAALHVVAGNLFQEETVRQKGASVTGEVELGEKIRLGVSALATASRVRWRQMAALYLRLGLAEGSSLLSELGVVRESPSGGTRTFGDFFFAQTMTRLTRGLHLLMTFEQYAEDFTRGGARYYRAGPGLLYLPVQRLEFRADFQATRALGLSVVSQDIYTLMTQVHVWL